MGNTKQMELAWYLYAGENRDNLVVGGAYPSWYCGDWETLDSPRDRGNWDTNPFIKQSVLWPYCGKSAAIWKSPSDRSTAIAPSNHVVPRTRSVSMNCWVNGGLTNTAGYVMYHKLSDMIDPGPAGTFVFLDEREDSINDGYFAVDMIGFPNPQMIGDYPARYHLNAAGIPFSDGHSEIHPWRVKETMPPLGANDMPLGVASPRNQDVAWLQQHSIRPVTATPIPPPPSLIH
jgi:hypothetical protein